MELKPGYKQTELGVFPEDWDVVTATEACTLVVDCKNRTPPVVAESDYAVVRTPNVRNGQFVLEDLRFTDESSYREWTARAIPEFGDIMITREAPLGEVCAVPAGRKVCLGQRMMLYRPSPTRTVSGYLLYALMSSPVKADLLSKIGGSTVGHAKVDDIRLLKIPLPSLPEQRAIAAALSDIDALLSGLDRLIAKKRDLKQAAMQQLLTGKTRLPGFEGDWEVRRLGEIADVKTGPFGSSLHESDYVQDGTPIITVEHLGEFGVQHVNLPLVSDADRRRLQAYSLMEGDIVFSRVGSVDRNALIRSAEVGWLFSGRLLRVRPERTRVFAPFLSYQFHSEPFKALVRNVAVGQTMASLNTRILNGLRVVIPALAEQNSITTVLSDMDAELEALEARREKTRSLKQGMMQELLTGRTRLV
jgi:type I restriction enzyme S subunit